MFKKYYVDTEQIGMKMISPILFSSENILILDVNYVVETEN